ncbi:MAG TPA: SEC-C metal-binding domain-containing protein [Pseudonocardiaceae bacterium]|nr:SEC-C metal-binding domain-containing protein [Pseudonocardiaceae bacterium]
MADSLPAADPELIDVISAVLAESGPLTEDQLAAALAGRGVDLGDDPDDVLYEALEDNDDLMVLADKRWVSLPAVLADRVFTHRVSESELEHDILAMSTDLKPLDMLTEQERYQRLVDGAPVVGVLLPFDADALAERGIPLDVVDEHGALLLPPGYLRERGLSEGAVIALSLTGDGLSLKVVSEHVIRPEAVGALGQRLSAVLATEPDEPMPLDLAVWRACVDDPTLFTEPLPPLGMALDTCGLAHDGEWLAKPGFDFDRWRVELRCAAITRRYDLTDDEALSVLAIVMLYHQVAEMHETVLAVQDDEAARAAIAAEVIGRPGSTDSDRDITVRATMPFLAEPAVAEAVLAETIGSGSEGAAALVLFAEALEPLVSQAARPALRWLCGKAHERLGDITEAEAAYQAAESADPQWSPALVDLARFASDRGDAARGLALLRRAGTPPDHLLVELLEHFQAPPRRDLGRNQPCWCGSGHKYKKCHLHHEQLPLEERAAWLYQKASMFLLDGPWLGAVVEAARVRTQFAEIPHATLDPLGEALVGDAVLFEGGAFEEFVAIRGGLLPADERLLAEQWLLIDRSVYEIEQVQRGAGFTMRDVRTGDVHQVRERTASQTVQAGALVCARVVSAGDTAQIFGGIEPVALHQRDELIALLDSKPDPLELVAFLTRRFAPVGLSNTEGDPLVLCEATLKTGDPAALTAKLDQTYQRDDTGTAQWIEHVTTHGMERIRATLRLDGPELTVHTNSEARIDRVFDTVHELDPTLTIIDQSRQPARDAREAAALAARTDPADDAHHIDPTAPEMAAALDRFIRDYEQKWLDESIPALAGNTPRQAAADPTRRGDLIRLLDSFPTHQDGPGMMSPDRLRAALDLR